MEYDQRRANGREDRQLAQVTRPLAEELRLVEANGDVVPILFKDLEQVIQP